MSVGTATDGAGGLTNSSGVFEIHSGVSPSGQTSGPWFFCHTEGFLGIYCGPGSMNTSYTSAAWFTAFICRSCDASGASSGNGLFITTQANNTAPQTSSETTPVNKSYNYASSTWYGDTTSTTNGQTSSFMMLPGGADVSSYYDPITNTVAVFPAFGGNPQPFPIPQMVACWASDATPYTTFVATPIGTTQRTYFAVRWDALLAAPYQIDELQFSNNTAGWAFVWE